jgi:hypothetical protein
VHGQFTPCEKRSVFPILELSASNEPRTLAADSKVGCSLAVSRPKGCPFFARLRRTRAFLCFAPPKSVTHVLTHECYLCPDCALRQAILDPPSSILIGCGLAALCPLRLRPAFRVFRFRRVLRVLRNLRVYRNRNCNRNIAVTKSSVRILHSGNTALFLLTPSLCSATLLPMTWFIQSKKQTRTWPPESSIAVAVTCCHLLSLAVTCSYLHQVAPTCG